MKTVMTKLDNAFMQLDERGRNMIYITFSLDKETHKVSFDTKDERLFKEYSEIKGTQEKYDFLATSQKSLIEWIISEHMDKIQPFNLNSLNDMYDNLHRLSR